MVKVEKAFKWGIAIIVIFGILNALYFLNLVAGLKIALPILCIFLIGSILLQSGKGGGLAAIGGLGDQSAFGTRTSTFLTKVTYLIGAAFIVATIFLFKLSLPTKAVNTLATQEAPVAQHPHEHSAHEHEEEHTHGTVPGTESGTGDASKIDMKNVEEKQGESTQKNYHHSTGKKNGGSDAQSVGLHPVDEKKQATGIPEETATEEQKVENSNK